MYLHSLLQTRAYPSELSCGANGASKKVSEKLVNPRVISRNKNSQLLLAPNVHLAVQSDLEGLQLLMLRLILKSRAHLRIVTFDEIGQLFISQTGLKRGFAAMGGGSIKHFCFRRLKASLEAHELIITSEGIGPKPLSPNPTQKLKKPPDKHRCADFAERPRPIFSLEWDAEDAPRGFFDNDERPAKKVQIDDEDKSKLLTAVLTPYFSLRKILDSFEARLDIWSVEQAASILGAKPHFPWPKWNLLFIAVWIGNIGACEAIADFLRQSNPNASFFNSVNHHHQSLLHIACLRSEETIVEWLLSSQADPNIQNIKRGNQTPLHLAALKGNVGCVRGLLKAQADVNALALNGHGPCSALQIAIRCGHNLVVQALLDHNASSQTENGVTPLERALATGNDTTTMAVFLASQTVSRSIVRSVISANCLKLVHALFENSKNPSYWLTAITQATEYGHVESVKALLSYMNVPPDHLFAVLTTAISKGFTSIVDCLLTIGVAVPSNIRQPLLDCITRGRFTYSLARLLVNANCDLFEIDNSGLTPLHHAVVQEPPDNELVAFLCEHYPTMINQENEVGYSPLHEVVRAKATESLPLLINAGADVNLRNRLREGMTPLHLAAACGWASGIKALVRAGADVNCKKLSWKPPRTAVGIATKSGFDQTVTALMELGAKAEGLVGRKVNIEFSDQEPEHLSRWMYISQDERAAKIRERSMGDVEPVQTDLTAHQGPWKVVRIFISSTFRDMHAERNLLVSQVLPALRKRCQERRLHLVDIDLRWGVTEAEAQSGESVELCLREVSNCNIFISLIAGRYGWVPGPNEARSRYPVAASSDLSITAMEIEQALSRRPDIDCIFFIRDPSLEANIPSQYRSDFTETEERPQCLLAELKQRVRASKSVVTEYTANFEALGEDGEICLGGLETMGEELSLQLWDAIDRRYPLSAVQADAFVVESNFHKDFVQSKSSSFVGRSEVVSKLMQYVSAGSGKPLVITGGAGSGKSALMGYFAQHAHRETRNTVVVVHSVGASPMSTNIYDSIWHLCSAIIHEFAFWDKVPSEYHERVQLFRELLQRIPQTKRRLLIIFDALNQLDYTNRSHSLNWLPSELPAEVCIIVSCLEGDCLDVLRRRGTPELKLEGLSNQERSEMVTRLLGAYQKKLDANQMDCLLGKTDAMHPLYLVVACEELRVFGVFEKLTAKVQSLDPTIQGIFTQSLQRLETQHGDECKKLLSFLFLSRHGLMETELFGLVQLSTSKFAALLMTLQMFLRVVGKAEDGYLDFFHRQFAKAVETRYLQASTKRAYHFGLAAYHRSIASPDGPEDWKGTSIRAFQSLPYHSMHADPAMLVALLSDLKFVQAKCERGLIHDLIADYTAAEELAEAEPLFKELTPFRQFLIENSHILELHPSLMFQQGSLSRNEVVRDAASWLLDQSSIVCTNYTEPVRDFFASMVGPERVNVVHYAPDNKSLIVGYFDGSLILWNATTFARIAFVMSNRGRITDACFSPKGELVAAASGQGVDIYQTSTLNLLHTLLDQDGCHLDEVLCCAFQPSGRYLVSGGADRRLVLWDWANERVACSEILCKQEDIVQASSTRGASVALSGVSREVVQGSIVSCGFGSDSMTIVSGSANKMVYIHCLQPDETKKSFGEVRLNLKRTLGGHIKCVNHVAIAPGCRIIASVGQDRSLIVWDVATGDMLFSTKSHTENVACVNFSPTGKYLVTAAWDKTLKVFECVDPTWKNWTEMGTLRGHAHYCNYADFSPNGKLIVSGSVDMTVSTYHFNGSAVGTPPTGPEVGHKDIIRSLQYCAARDTILTSSWDRQVKMFDRSGSELWALTASSKRVNGVDISPDGELFATAASDFTARLWETDTRQEVLVLEGHTDAVFAVVFSHDMQYVATGSCDKTIIIWSLETAGKITQFTGHEDWVMSLHFSMFSRRLVSGCQSGQVKVWDVVRQSNLTTISAHTGPVLACLFTPCEKAFVSASVDKLVKVWDAVYYTNLLTIAAHSNEVTSLTFITSPSLPLSIEARAAGEDACVTTHVISGSSDKSIVVSDFQTGAYVRSYHGAGAVMALSAIDSTHFAAGDSLGVFSLLEVRAEPKADR